MTNCKQCNASDKLYYHLTTNSVLCEDCLSLNLSNRYLDPIIRKDFKLYSPFDFKYYSNQEKLAFITTNGLNPQLPVLIYNSFK